MNVRGRAPQFRLASACVPLLLLLFPRTANANAGTPLMLAGAFHLLLGNAAIGLIEAAILAWFLRARFWKAALVMVIGNYVAWWSCGALLPSIERLTALFLDPNPLLNIGAVIKSTIVAAFIASLIIEAPFSYLAACIRWTRREERKPTLLRFAFTHIAAQSATYALLVLWYSSASETSLLRVPVQPDILRRLPNGSVRFTDTSGNLARIPLRGGPAELLGAIASITSRYELRSARTLDPDSDWTVHTTDWATALVAEHKNGSRLYVALETPLVTWSASNATVLPGGYVVYQLGEQIVVLDVNGPAIAPLTMGTEPYVVLE
jgi:hypothetical protein